MVYTELSPKDPLVTAKPRVDWLITQMQVRGGAETFALTILPYLNQYFSVRLITLMTDNDYSPKLQSRGVEVISLGMRSKYDIKSILSLFQIWKNHPPQILHTHLYHAGVLGRILGRLCGIKKIYCHQAGPEFDRSPLRSILDRVTSSFVDRYTVSCKAVGDILHRREGIPSVKITIIPNTYENTPFHPIAQYRKDDEIFSLISAGRLESEKNHTVLISALSLIKDIPFKLIILGEGSLLPALKSQADRLLLSDRIDFPGFHPDIAHWLIKAQVFILPSKWEGVSIAMLQAMSMGLCVIATNAGGTPEVITHEVTGLLVPPDNPKALADAISYLYHHPNMRAKMGLNAQQHVIQNYSINSTLTKLKMLYLNPDYSC